MLVELVQNETNEHNRCYYTNDGENISEDAMTIYLDDAHPIVGNLIIDYALNYC